MSLPSLDSVDSAGRPPKSTLGTSPFDRPLTPIVTATPPHIVPLVGDSLSSENGCVRAITPGSGDAGAPSFESAGSEPLTPPPAVPLVAAVPSVPTDPPEGLIVGGGSTRRGTLAL